MKFSWSKSKAIPQDFWKWFIANSSHYTHLSEAPDMENRLDEFQQQLHKIDERLAFEFLGNPTDHSELIISADGDSEAFPVVQSLVDAAPQIDGWQIIAFRQRGDTECAIKMGDVDLGPEQMWFRLEADGDKVGLNLYFGGIELNDEVAGAAFILLDNALGEYDMETKVGFIERHQLQTEADVTRLQAFEKLPTAFDSFYHQLKH